MQLGFLGAGLMSAPMIENLLADGHELSVWNRTAARSKALVDAGALAVERAADVCTPGGVIFSCLADDIALDAVFADGQVVAALGEGGVHASMSTISAACSERLEAEHDREPAPAADAVGERPEDRPREQAERADRRPEGARDRIPRL